MNSKHTIPKDVDSLCQWPNYSSKIFIISVVNYKPILSYIVDTFPVEKQVKVLSSASTKLLLLSKYVAYKCTLYITHLHMLTLMQQLHDLVNYPHQTLDTPPPILIISS